MKISENLKAAKALIENPEHWMQEDYFDTGIMDTATCFCALGAVRKVSGEVTDWTPEARYLRDAVFSIDHGVSVDLFNDESTHEEVMKMFDKAILIAESEGA